MRVLLVGGSGMVGTFITPYLAERHFLRVLDGCDTFITLVMNGAQGGASTEQSVPLIVSNYEVNTVGLHLLLYTAQELGIRRGIHTSTMSVHYRARTHYQQEE